jgi:flagellar biosynthesis/type III secretory pathway protein FliH
LTNLVAALFRLENSRTSGDLFNVLETLIDWLKEPEQTSLRRAFTVWIKRVVLREGADAATWEHVNELNEVHTMLAERVKEWEQDWRERGYAAGRESGLQEGMEKGLNAERALLHRLTHRRFGENVAGQIVTLLNQINDPEQLADVGEWILDCQTGAELLTRVQQLPEKN